MTANAFLSKYTGLNLEDLLGQDLDKYRATFLSGGSLPPPSVDLASASSTEPAATGTPPAPPSAPAGPVEIKTIPFNDQNNTQGSPGGAPLVENRRQTPDPPPRGPWGWWGDKKEENSPGGPTQPPGGSTPPEATPPTDPNALPPWVEKLPEGPQKEEVKRLWYLNRASRFGSAEDWTGAKDVMSMMFKRQDEMMKRHEENTRNAYFVKLPFEREQAAYRFLGNFAGKGIQNIPQRAPISVSPLSLWVLPGMQTANAYGRV